MPSRSPGQILFALALLGAALVYASQILQMSRPFASGEPGPAFLPMILSGFVIFACLRLIHLEFRKPAAGHGGEAVQAADDGMSEVPRLGLVGPLVAIGLSVLFVLGFVYLGYLPAAFVYTALIATFFNYERGAGLRVSALIGLGTGAAVTLFGWLFFVELFDLYLPMWEL